MASQSTVDFKVGFTKISALFLLCHTDAKHIFKDIKNTSDFYSDYITNKKTENHKEFCKNIITIADDIDLENKKICTLFSNLIPEINVEIYNSLSELTDPNLEKPPHLIISCPPFFTDTIDAPSVQDHHNMIFITPILQGKYWMDSCEITKKNNHEVAITPLRSGQYFSCDYHNCSADEKKILVKDIFAGYNTIASQYPIISIIRPIEAILIIRLFHKNWAHITSRATHEINQKRLQTMNTSNAF